MNKQPQIRLTLLLLAALSLSTSALAFSTPPDDAGEYEPADWTKSDSAEDDANTAIEHDDLRLLGFAGRGTIIPGIDSSLIQRYSDKCGVRYFDEFGDVVRDREQLEMMTRAKDYALGYNRVILTSCSLDSEAK